MDGKWKSTTNLLADITYLDIPIRPRSLSSTQLLSQNPSPIRIRTTHIPTNDNGRARMLRGVDRCNIHEQLTPPFKLLQLYVHVYVYYQVGGLSGKITALQVELAKEKELRDVELELMEFKLSTERELREKDVSKEKELREKDVSKEKELREKAEQFVGLAVDHRILDLQFGAEYEELRKKLYDEKGTKKGD